MSARGGKTWAWIVVAALAAAGVVVFLRSRASSTDAGAARDSGMTVVAGREARLRSAPGPEAPRSSRPSVAIALPSGVVLGIRPGVADVSSPGAPPTRVTVTSPDEFEPDKVERTAAGALARAYVTILADGGADAFSRLVEPPLQIERRSLASAAAIASAAREMFARYPSKDPASRVRIEKSSTSAVAELSLYDRFGLDERVRRQFVVLPDDVEVTVDLAAGPEMLGRLFFVFRKRAGAVRLEGIF